jgi:hypothetical protein
MIFSHDINLLHLHEMQPWSTSQACELLQLQQLNKSEQSALLTSQAEIKMLHPV